MTSGHSTRWQVKLVEIFGLCYCMILIWNPDSAVVWEVYLEQMSLRIEMLTSWDLKFSLWSLFPNIL